MKNRLRYLGVVPVLLLLIVFLVPAGMAAAASVPGDEVRPMIFVHGFLGSGAQFESQAMRFTSNGYPSDYIDVFEYDSLSLRLGWITLDQLYPKIDDLIDRTLARTGEDKVYMLGHSMGTTVLHGYLNSSPDRAARVAKYVNIDGRTGDAPPGGVPTLAIWAEHGIPGRTTPGREIVGATNVTIPNQTHVEVATSPEAFVEMYRFFLGEDPVTSMILPDVDGKIELAGRGVYFPENEGAQGFTLQVWEVEGATGMRKKDSPDYVKELGADGTWGPFEAKRGARYEFCLLPPDNNPFHIYYEPFLRDNYLIRLNVSKPGGIADHMEESDAQSNLTIVRYKEFWGDRGEENDVLTVDGTNIILPEGCMQSAPTIAIFAFDVGTDGVTDLSAPEAYYDPITFLTGVDLFIPAAEPPNRSVSLVLTPRGGGGGKQVINVPNWASTRHRVIVQFNDYLQQPNTLYFAEGHVSDQFKEYLTISNPNPLKGLARVAYIFPDRKEKEVEYPLPPQARTTIDVNAELAGLMGYTTGDVALRVRCELGIYAERPMYFDYRGKWRGGHVGRGAASPSKEWYFAEGYTGGEFEMWVCILNPNPERAVCTFRFQTQEEGEIVKENLVVPALSRQTFNANDLLEGKDYNTSLVVSSTLPVVAERPMYFSYAYRGLAVQGGHCALGATRLSDEFFFAEGTTRGGFHAWLTLQNPHDHDITVTATYYLGEGQGEAVEDSYLVNKQSRYTVFVPDVVGEGKDVSVSLYCPEEFLAERPMYFSYSHGGLAASGGDCGGGATAALGTWFLAEGYTGEGFHTWLCLLNPFEEDVEATVTYLTQEKGALDPKPVSVPAGRRVTILVNDHAGPGYQLSAVVRTVCGPGVVVERPMYFRYGDRDGGHVSTGLGTVATAT